MEDSGSRGSGDVDRKASESSSSESGANPAAIRRAASVLRVLSFGFVVGGFAGALGSNVSPIGLDSAFSVVFAVGVVFALASIYLGVFAANRDT